MTPPEPQVVRFCNPQPKLRHHFFDQSQTQAPLPYSHDSARICLFRWLFIRATPNRTIDDGSVAQSTRTRVIVVAHAPFYLVTVFSVLFSTFFHRIYARTTTTCTTYSLFCPRGGSSLRRGPFSTMYTFRTYTSATCTVSVSFFFSDLAPGHVQCTCYSTFTLDRGAYIAFCAFSLPPPFMPPVLCTLYLH